MTLDRMQIGPLPSTKVEKAKIKVRVRLNLHGIVFVDSATVSFFRLRMIVVMIANFSLFYDFYWEVTVVKYRIFVNLV